MEFRVPTAAKKRFTFYCEDGTQVSFVGYFYWEYPFYKELLGKSRIRKVTYSFDYKSPQYL